MSRELSGVLAGGNGTGGTGQDFGDTVGSGRGGALHCYPHTLDTCLLFSSKSSFFPFNFVLLNIPASLSTSSISSLSLGSDPLTPVTVTMALFPLIALPAFLSILFCPQKSLESLLPVLTCGSFLSSVTRSSRKWLEWNKMLQLWLKQ